jgi:hypothetical protein
MKIDRDHVSETLGIRVAEGDHLVVDAIQGYRGLRSKKAVLEEANRCRKLYARYGKYLQALIHDQIYRLHGGED